MQSPWGDAAYEAVDHDSEFSAYVLIAIGALFAPLIVGIPLIFVGVNRLSKTKSQAG